LGSFGAFGQSPYTLTPTLEAAYQEAFKMRLGVSKKYLTAEKNRANAFVIYVENYVDMVSLLVSDDKAKFEQLAKNQDIRLGLLEKLPQDSPYARFLQAEVRLQWAFVKLKFGKEASACWDIIKAYRLLDENAQKFPDFLPTYKSLGLLHVLIGATPENYRWVPKLLGMKGNIQQGLREMRLVCQKEGLWNVETKLVELLLYAYVLKYTEKQNQDLLALVKSQPDNLLVHFFGTTISMKDGRGEQALQILQQRPADSSYLPFPFLSFLKAEILLQKGDYEASRGQVKAFLGQYRGRNFLKDAQLKLFLSHWLAHEDAAAKPYLTALLTTGSTYVESDKAAQKFAENFQKGLINDQQKVLMKARLAFDGGYLQEAANTLRPFAENTFTVPRDRAEYQYRWGRILQRQNQPDAALVHYERAWTLSQPQGWYFGATSALQLGYIFQAKGQKQKAVGYFKRALEYPKHEYKNSIDNKARAALTEMGVE
jgi:tetratricopeptide (TPR) repeat protein